MALWRTLHDLSGIWGLMLLCPLYLFALLRGDPTGRALAHVLAAGASLGTMLATIEAGPMQQASEGQLGLDTLLLAAQIVLSLRSLRHYPIAIAAAQLQIVLIDAFAWAGLIAQPATALWLGGLLGAIQLGVFSYGVITHRTPRRSRAIRAEFEAQTGQTA